MGFSCTDVMAAYHRGCEMASSLSRGAGSGGSRLDLVPAVPPLDSGGGGPQPCMPDGQRTEDESPLEGSGARQEPDTDGQQAGPRRERAGALGDAERAILDSQRQPLRASIQPGGNGAPHLFFGGARDPSG